MTDANEYGKALFLITEEDGTSDKVIADVRLADSVLKLNPDYVKLLNSPAVSKQERVELIDKAFGSLDEKLVNLVKILTERRSVNLFGKICEAYYAYFDESRGILRVNAITAIPLSEQQSESLSTKLGKMLSKTVVINNTVDASILGGIKLRYSGVQIDGSIKTKLDNFETALKNTVI